jgi:hypothetical protein
MTTFQSEIWLFAVATTTDQRPDGAEETRFLERSHDLGFESFRF